MAASLEHAGSEVAVTLRNLSAHGALVEGDLVFEAGTRVTFRRNGLEVAGRIAWAQGRRAGIAFAMRLDPQAILRHIPAPGPLRDQVHKRPGLRGKLSREERRTAEFLYGRPLPRGEL